MWRNMIKKSWAELKSRIKKKSYSDGGVAKKLKME